MSQRCSTAKSKISRLLGSSLSQKQNPSILNRSEESFHSSTVKSNGFLSTYKMTCDKYKTRPVTSVKVNRKNNSVEILGDRLKVEDWQSVLESLSTDISIHHIRIKNKKYTENLAKDYETFLETMAAPK